MLSTRVDLHFLGMSVCKTCIELRKGSAASQIRSLYFYFIRLPAERWRAQISDWVHHDRNGASNDPQTLVGTSDYSISREKGRKGERRAPVVHSACGKQLATWYRLRGYKPQHEGTAKRKKKTGYGRADQACSDQSLYLLAARNIYGQKTCQSPGLCKLS